jgi:hypothetical protein
MTKGPDATKGERIKDFFRRLASAPAAADHDEAFRQVTDNPLPKQGA